nr:MAG TPA: hypothetical protein [Caudoviricetes sp.]
MIFQTKPGTKLKKKGNPIITGVKVKNNEKNRNISN